MEKLSGHTAGARLTLPNSRRVDVFLCHNSKDKPIVRQVADGLELEFGMPHFLDVFAIPTGEAFLPWIDQALATSSGCAIFLGANGWGETHFWEAERALDRYRVDPHFKVIPVALPGIRDEDMNRLGSGTLFQQVNWADFRNGPVDPDAIDKLRAAMQGKPWQMDHGPARLTPYVIRRDAGRWVESGRKDLSILYRGRQLEEAYALRAAQPDLVTGDAIFAFLAESAAAQSRRQRRVTGVSIAAAAVIAVLATRAQQEGQLALARFVAAEARQAPSPDTGLLLAVQAAAISDTPEAYGALVERLDAQPYLHHMFRVENGVSSLAFDPEGTRLYVASLDGKLFNIDLQSMKQTVDRVIDSPALAMDIDRGTGELWVGAQNGLIHISGPDGTRQVVELPGSEGLPIIALQIDPTGRWVAVGNHNHQLLLLDRARRVVAWTHTVTAQRVTAVSFAADGGQVAVASNEGLIEIFRSDTGAPVHSMSTAKTGNPRALQFARNGDLRVIDDLDTFWVFQNGQETGRATALKGEAQSVAAIGPRIDRGPMQRLDLVMRGFSTGDLALPAPYNAVDKPTLIPAHARTVSAVALSHEGRWAASGAGDGTVALWDLQRRSLLFTPGLTPGGEFIDLAYDDTNRPIAVTAAADAALLSSQSPTGWTTLADLMSLTAKAAGQQSVTAAEARPDAKGFVEVMEKNVVSAAAFSARATSVAWSTPAGALMWSSRPFSGTPHVLRANGPAISKLVLDELGRALYAVEGENKLLFFDLSLPHTQAARHKLPYGVRAMVPTAKGKAVLVALDDQTLRRIDFSTKLPHETMRATLPVTVGSLAREPSSDLLLAAGAGSTAGIDVGVINGTSFRRLHSRRMGGAVRSLTLSRSAGLIAAGDHYGRLHLWDRETLIPMASLQVTHAALTNMTISHDGQEMTVTSEGGDMFRLSLDRKRWLREACRLVGRELSPAEWGALVPGSKPEAACGALAQP